MVNLAPGERSADGRRLRSLAEAVAAYEDEFGPITVAEIAAQEAADRAAARVCRPPTR